MKRIDFMPQSFNRRHARRRETARTFALLALLLGAMVAWVILVPDDELVRLDQCLDSLDWQVATESVLHEEAARREHERNVQSEQAILVRTLHSPVPITSIFAAITERMPPALGLTSLSLEGTPVDPAPAAPTVQSEFDWAPVPTAEPSSEDALRLVLHGLAPDSVAIAKLIGALDRHPLFDDVELAYSGPTETGDLIAREFQVTATIALNRTYVLVADGEAHHED